MVTGTILLSLSVFGALLSLVQLLSLFGRRSPPQAKTFPPISILKPLCGSEEGLEEAIAAFATLDYPDYEVVLGVKDTQDGAFRLALSAARKFGPRVRLAIQRGEPGLNPKVNQLITLAAKAKHEILVVSDSNVHVQCKYLQEIAAHFEDPQVGLVSHPIVASTSQSVGATLDMLHLTTGIAPGVIGSKRVARKDIVVGKSMALRRADLQKLGGFAAVKDVLAEDFILGKMVRAILKKRLVLADTPVENRATLKTVRQFFKRYQRWAVIHHHAVGLPLYVAELVLNPLALAALALIADASAQTLAIALAIGVFKLACDGFAARALTGRFLSLRALALIPLKDALLFFAWVYGLVSRRIDWRGTSLLVLPGTLLQRPSEAAVPAEAMS